MLPSLDECFGSECGHRILDAFFNVFRGEARVLDGSQHVLDEFPVIPQISKIPDGTSESSSKLPFPLANPARPGFV